MVILGCVQKPKQGNFNTGIDYLLKNNFKGIEHVNIDWIKKESESKSYPYASFDQVWDSTIIILIQKGIIVKASKDKGIIVTITNPPSAILVEKNDIVTVYLKWIEDLYRQFNPSQDISYKSDRIEIVKEMVKKEKAKSFLDNLATQIYAGEKWKYVY